MKWGKVALVAAAMLMAGQVRWNHDGKAYPLNVGHPRVLGADEPAAPAGGKTSGESITIIGPVPQRSFDVLNRFLTLTPDQMKKMSELRQEWMKERQEQIEQVERQLDAKYAPLAAAALDEKQQAAFKQVADAVAAYWQAMKEADAEYLDAWGLVAGEKPVRLPNNAANILITLPGITPQEKELAQKTQMEYFKQMNEEQTKAMEAAGVKYPTSRDVVAWQDYTQKSMQIRAELENKLQADYLAKMVGALGDTPTAKKFEQLAKALQTCGAKKKAAMAALVDKLKMFVSLDKLLYPGFSVPPAAPGAGR